MTTIQIRIDEKTKRSAKKVLDSLGIDVSSAIKMYLHQIVLRQGIPFQLLTENGLTLQQETEILQAADEAKRGVIVSPAFNTAKEAIAYLKHKE